MKTLRLLLMLICFAATSTLFADNIDTHKTITALKSKLNDASLTVNEDALAQNTEFVELVLGTESMDAKEKQYWLSQQPSLADKQIERMVKILKDEKQKLADLDERYKKESAEMTLRHAKERIIKIHELLQKPKKHKLSISDLAVGIEAIDTYLSSAPTKDKSVLLKALPIIDATLKDKKLSDSDRYSLHDMAYSVYVTMGDTSKIDAKMHHLVKSIEYLRLIISSSEDGKNYNQRLAQQLSNLSYLQVCKGNFAEAIKHADEVLSIESQMVSAIVNKAHALLFLGRADEAKAEYQKALNSKMRDEVMQAIKDDAKELAGLKHPKEKTDAMMAILDELMGAKK